MLTVLAMKFLYYSFISGLTASFADSEIFSDRYSSVKSLALGAVLTLFVEYCINWPLRNWFGLTEADWLQYAVISTILVVLLAMIGGNYLFPFNQRQSVMFAVIVGAAHLVLSVIFLPLV